MDIIVHGGAGGDPEEPAARQTVLDRAAAEGARAETPLDAVEAALQVLERSPRFNAGIGGAVQSDGVPRTDAGVMTGDGSVGAVASMEGVDMATSVARLVKTETPHVLLAGRHAEALAADYGVETDVDLFSERSREKWDEAPDPPSDGPKAQLSWVRERFGGTDTVGAVAAAQGRVAAATSTGGRWFALAGRVGDVPQIGSGFYASDAGAASATGAGEDIARVTLTRMAVDQLEAGLGPQAAADRAIEVFEERTGSRAGVIVMDAAGNRGSAFNSDAMQTGRASLD
jgi:isoaspartyl peptidase/L-asparaginase-like protein (Ntn-hydrolase superfamily)